MPSLPRQLTRKSDWWPHLQSDRDPNSTGLVVANDPLQRVLWTVGGNLIIGGPIELGADISVADAGWAKQEARRAEFQPGLAYWTAGGWIPRRRERVGGVRGGVEERTELGRKEVPHGLLPGGLRRGVLIGIRWCPEHKGIPGNRSRTGGQSAPAANLTTTALSGLPTPTSKAGVPCRSSLLSAPEAQGLGKELAESPVVVRAETTQQRVCSGKGQAGPPG